ncbi:dynamin family protein [Phototrophicus methaneseepsis]|uniref:Dynamin family protein n=1 Tax=Phototrophicus methaneseepsis TaxID=2710758 RepID=A0A7S8E5I0_9CHLR|nr:dynamin family protein [Phototrophicus methaneseepsis]QPC80751.1 dynamin family protein [Phototrophicus methaneseepsis]
MTTSTDNRLAQDYEALRRREYTLIDDLLGVLPKIEKLGEDRVGQVRDAMFHADHPFLMVFVGPFSSGKSSLINALLGAKDLLKIGPTPTTDRISILRWGDEPQDMNSGSRVDTVFYPSPLLRKVSFVDTPGLESVFQHHEETTRRFLHRSDVVMLVMLATQAMSQANIDYMKTLREYGKKIIIVINQSDLLSDEDRETVRQYVADQCRDLLGIEPPIWLVSAKQGTQARSAGTFDEALWKQSGMQQFEDYIEKQLSDADRLRQKLQTPLQIVQNVHGAALEAVKDNQSTFDQYRSISDNIDQQLKSQRRGQEKAVREVMAEVEAQFKDTADRSGEALHDVFRMGLALPSFGRGVLELFGIARLFRRNDAPSHMEQAFSKYKVFEPIDNLPEVVDKLAPRLEAQDMQDIDNLVRYGQGEIQKLPEELRSKIIGRIQAPAVYDRKELLNLREPLELIEDEARVLETEKIEQARRTTLLYLAIWELISFVLLIALLGAWGALDAASDLPLNIIMLIVVLGAIVGGFAALPLRGRMLHVQYVNRLHKLQNRYVEALRQAADRQVEYGMQLRRDAIAPLTRLVEAQAAIQDEQMAELQKAEQEIHKLESELNAFGKRKLLGISL